MKNLVLIGLFALFLFSCGNAAKNVEQTAVEEPETEAVVLSVDQLYENAVDNVDKEIIVKGTVMHVCQQGGQRCFLMGSNEDVNIRIEAGEKIGTFSQELMGSDLEIVGILKEVKTEADAHNPGKEHGTEAAETEETAETAAAHKIIAEAQEKTEIVYFIEGIKVKEL